MPITLGANIFSQRAIGALQRNTSALERTFERLSSGQRINRASDDPAGLNVSEGLKTKAKVLTRGSRNIDDAISALSIADATLTQVGTLLRRQAELSEQAASGSLSSAQRSALDTEYQELDKEIRRLGDTASFNGINLFAGERKFVTLTAVAAASGSATSQISADGRYLTFRDNSGNLIQHDLTTGSTSLLVSNANPTKIAASANGEKVAFISTSDINGLNTSNRSTVYIYDRNSGVTTRANVASVGEAISNIAISADGGTVAFASLSTYNSDGSALTATSTGDKIHTYDTNSGITHFTEITVGEVLHQFISSLKVSPNGNRVGYVYGDEDLGDSGIGVFSIASPNSTHSVKALSGLGEEFTTNLSVSNNGIALFQADDPGSVYSFDTNTQVLTTILAGTGGTAGVAALTLSNDGSFFTLLAGYDLAGTGNTTLQAFRYDFSTGRYTQLTSNTNNTQLNPNANAQISSDGNTLVAFNGSHLVTSSIGMGSSQLGIETGVGSSGSGTIIALLGTVNSTLQGLGGHLLTTASSARGALDGATRNIDLLSQLQGEIGSSLSRLDSARRVTQAQANEIITARNRIVDLDVATEGAELARLKILQQSGTSILSQANQIPKLALKLLQNI